MATILPILEFYLFPQPDPSNLFELISYGKSGIRTLFQFSEVILWGVLAATCIWRFKRKPGKSDLDSENKV